MAIRVFFAVPGETVDQRECIEQYRKYDGTGDGSLQKPFRGGVVNECED